MGRLKITPGGGGADLDVVTAGAGDVLAGKVIVDREGEPLVGSIPGRSAATITPSTANQIINAGQYLSGVQTILGDPNLQAANIKKGVPIFGKVGTFQGYVDSPLYFYNKGVWSNLSKTGASGVHGANVVEKNAAIRVNVGASYGPEQYSKMGARLNSSVNLTNYNYVIIHYTNNIQNDVMLAGKGAWLSVSPSPNIIAVQNMAAYVTGGGNMYIALNVSSLTGDYWIYFGRNDNDLTSFGLYAIFDEIYLSNN